mgnify:CR=1 FL=1
MIFFPAIDICEGSCVRLEKGDFNKKTIFNKNPLDQAKFFEDLGCDWLHVVDLDGAREGVSKNYPFIDEIVSNTCLLYTSTSQRDQRGCRMASSA